ncbi:MAG TPA: glycosyltransferase [Gemmatimonadaceae bacterium]|nr:glycosyltransferase [Gemmatimonadaceae bacterium]
MLRSRGHRVFVLTQRLEGEGDSPRVDEPGLEVHTVPLGPQYRLRALDLARSLRLHRGRADRGPGVPAHPVSAPSSHRAPVRPGLLRRMALSLLWLPDDELRFVRPALRAAREIVRRNGIDVVYTSTPPHSTHLVGLRLRATERVRWVAEFRDPWTDARSPEQVEHWFGPVEAVHRWLERRCLRAADRVVTVTGGTRDAMADRLPPAERDKVVVALNGIASLEPRREGPAAGPFRIVHAGTFYHDRDPRPFLRALASVRRERSLGPAEVVVDLVGHCRTFGDVSVEREVEELGLSDMVRFHDWLPHDEARQLLRVADLALLLATSQPLQVPNKLFDYVGARTPILGIVDAGGESERMLRGVGGQYVVPVATGERVPEDAIRAALASALDAGPGGPDGTDEKLLREWSTGRQMERLAAAIGA